MTLIKMRRILAALVLLTPTLSFAQIAVLRGGMDFGSIMYGSSGTCLVSNGTASPPTFQACSGTGGVSTVSVASANGFAGTVANATTTPAITLSTSINGPVKGNGTALQAASASDIYNLFSGTPSSTCYLSGSGACSVPSGSGTGLTSVGLSAPSFLTVTGNPLTANGTLALSYSGTALPIANGGTGNTTGNAATATSIAGGTANQIPYQTGAGATSFFSASNYGVQTYGGTGVPTSIAGAAGVLQGSVSAVPAFTTTPTLTGTNFSNIPYSALSGTPTTWNQSTTGNAATATALATTPTQCTGGQYATGIAASGNANCGSPSGSGTVTTASVVTANGFAGTVATATTTPAVTLTTSVSGLIKGSSSALTAAASADVIGLFSGTCSSSTVLMGNGTCSAGTPIPSLPSYTTPVAADLMIVYSQANAAADQSTIGVLQAEFLALGLRIQTAATGTTLTPTVGTADQVNQANTQATGTLTIANPTGSPTDGQRLTIRITSTNVQTYSWGTAYHAGATALPTASTGSSKHDYIGFIYDAVTSQWDYVSTAAGF